MEDHTNLDSYVEVTDNAGYANSLSGAMKEERNNMDVQEKNAGTRFHDDGERIPGRRKGINDRNPDRPAMLYPLGPGR